MLESPLPLFPPHSLPGLLQPLPFPAGTWSHLGWAGEGWGRQAHGGGEWHWGRLEQPEQKLLLQELRDDSEGDL